MVELSSENEVDGVDLVFYFSSNHIIQISNGQYLFSQNNLS